MLTTDEGILVETIHYNLSTNDVMEKRVEYFENVLPSITGTFLFVEKYEEHGSLFDLRYQ